MKANKYNIFIFVNLIILFNSFNSYYLAQIKQNSIIKIFCLQSVKEEMMKAEIVYSKEIANETCDCYYEDFMQTGSHQAAKTKYKLETKENLNHNRKI